MNPFARNHSTEQKFVFILGCERSGSTWISNILGLHPRVNYYFEPFSNQSNDAFADWYKRYEIPENSEFEKKNVFDKLARTHRLRNGGNPGYWNDRRFGMQYRILKRMPSFFKTRKVRSFFHLNNYRYVNRLDFEKESTLPVVLVKELRLNLRWDFIRELFPDAKVIVPIRHPVLQIHSYLKTLERDSLIEFRNDLPGFLRWMETTYAIEPGTTLKEQVAQYIFINYSVLLNALEKHNSDFRVCPVEKYAGENTANIMDLTNWTGLEWSFPQERFVQKTTLEQNISQHALSIRKGSDHHRKQLDRLKGPEVRQIFSDFENLSSQIQNYSYLNELKTHYSQHN